MEHIQKVFVRLSQCEIQTKSTVVLQKTSLVDSTNKVLGSILMSMNFEQRKVIEVETLRNQQNIFPGTRKETHLHLT